MTDWDAVLDELERSLTDGSEFTPPEDPGVLPGHLLARAERLMERQRAAVEELEAERERVAAELDAHRRAAPRATNTTPSTGSALDL